VFRGCRMDKLGEALARLERAVARLEAAGGLGRTAGSGIAQHAPKSMIRS